MEPVVTLTIALVLAFGFAIGANDETVATAAGTGGISVKRAIALASILAFLGALFLSTNVSRSIGTGLLDSNAFDLPRYQPAILVSVLVSVSAWLVFAARIGAPVSTTQSVVGAIVGVSLCAPLLGTTAGELVNWAGLGRVVVGWVVSPMLGFACSVIVSLLMKYLVRRRLRGLRDFERAEGTFLMVLLGIVFFNQLNRAGNDAGNALGILHGLFEAGKIDGGSLQGLLVAGAAVIALGLFSIGRVLVRKVGKGLVEIRPTDAFCIETSVLVVLSLANMLGFPISGGHVLVFAILGMAMVKGEAVDRIAVKRMAVSWIITFPVAALASAGTLLVVLRVLVP